MRLILGSSSKWRRDLLEQIAPEFAVVVPDIDEQAIRHDDPGELVRRLAAAKSNAVQKKLTATSKAEAAVVITSDQVVVSNGVIYEKPESEAQAREWFAVTHLHPHETWTALHVVNTVTGQIASGLDVAKVWIDRLPPAVLDNIIAQGNWSYCGGGLNIDDSLVEPFISRREGDLDSVIGLPLVLTRDLVVQVGGETLLKAATG